MLILKKIFKLFSKEQKIKFIIIILGSIFVSIFEVFGIFSIGPLIAIVIDPSVIFSNKYLYTFYNYFNFIDVRYYIICYGIFSLILISSSNLFFLIILIHTLKFSSINACYLENKLLSNYLNQPYSFFLKRSSSSLSKNILAEVGKISGGITTPIISLISKSILIVIIISSLILINIIYSLLIFLIFFLTYCCIYFFVKLKNIELGKLSEYSNLNRYSILNKAFSFFKMLKITSTENFFLNDYYFSSKNYNQSNASSLILGQFPRFIIEIIAAHVIILLTLYLFYNENSGQVLSILSIYALAGLKLIPAFQEVYRSYNLINFYQFSLEKVLLDLNLNYKSVQLENVEIFKNFNKIKISNLSFSYESESKKIFSDVNIEISKGDQVGFIGKTGSGKTTFIDILIGLLMPTKGTIYIDDFNISRISNIWKSKIGYVPQNPFLIDGTILENIAYGQERTKIDLFKIEESTKSADIYDYINSLPNKFETHVGERGVRLSGGQVQRISIARALYKNPSVLVLDEATSSLDIHTEKKIMDSISNLSKDLTILIITHRFETLRHCNKIYKVENEKILLDDKSVSS